MRDDPIEERRAYVSTISAGPWHRRLALGVVLVSGAIFLGIAPFAKVPLAQVGAFIPIYQTALVINDVITAVLLFGQYTILRLRALRVLALGYLFTAGMAAVQRHGGRVWAESAPGEGPTFFFTLRPGAPAAAVPEPRGAPR